MFGFFCPYKRQSSVVCFITFKFSQIPLTSRCRYMQRRLYYTKYRYQYIKNTCACVESLHYLERFVVCFSNCTTRLRSLYIYNVLPECLFMCHVLNFLCVHSPRNALRSAFYRGKEKMYELSSALMFIMWNFTDKIGVLMAIDI